MNHSTPKPSTPTPPFVALDDLPPKRVRNALELMHYMRRTYCSALSVAPGSPSFAVAWDLAAAGYATIRPDDDDILAEVPGAMRFELVRREVR